MSLKGLPGSVGAVSISRLSTLLHLEGDIPAPTAIFKLRPIKRAPDSHRSLLSALALFTVAIPVQVAFVAIVYWFGWMDLPFLFVASFFGFFCISVSDHAILRASNQMFPQLCSSLVLAEVMTLSFWEQGWDPDNYCLPIHSAFCDLVGQLLLVACYEVVGRMGADVDL
jgi:solute carrier family 41